MQTKLSARETDVQRLESRVSLLEHEVSASQKTANECLARLQSEQKRTEALEKHVQQSHQLQLEVMSLSKWKSDANRTISELEEGRRTAELLLNERDAEIASLLLKVSYAEKDSVRVAQQQQSMIDQLLSQLNIRMSSLESHSPKNVKSKDQSAGESEHALREMIRTLESELESSKADLVHAREARGKLEVALARSAESAEELQKQLQSASRAQSGSEAEADLVNESLQHIARLEADKSELHRLVDDLRSRISREEARNVSEAEFFRSRISQLEALNQDVGEKLRDTCLSLDAAVRRKQEIEGRNLELLRRNELLENSSSSTVSRLVEAERVVEQMREQVRQKSAMEQKLDQKVVELQYEKQSLEQLLNDNGELIHRGLDQMSLRVIHTAVQTDDDGFERFQEDIAYHRVQLIQLQREVHTREKQVRGRLHVPMLVLSILFISMSDCIAAQEARRSAHR